MDLKTKISCRYLFDFFIEKINAQMTCHQDLLCVNWEFHKTYHFECPIDQNLQIKQMPLVKTSRLTKKIIIALVDPIEHALLL